MSERSAFIDGFRVERFELGNASIHAEIGGHGPPLLLLHGYPQTHVCWHRIAPELARDYTVVAADLRGYGDSRGPAADPTHASHSKRAVAADQVAVMARLGFRRFAVIGHDRGARVAHRLALDRPDAVSAFVSLTVIPTLEMWSRVDAAFALKNYHWFLFAQPHDLPERLLATDPIDFLDRTLARMAKSADALDARAVAEYRRAFAEPSVRHAMIEDYRAAATIDVEHDQADRAAGKRLQCPLLVLWEAGRFETGPDPVRIWRDYSDGVIEGGVVEGSGHLLAEEKPQAVLASITPFLARHAGPDAARG